MGGKSRKLEKGDNAKSTSMGRVGCMEVVRLQRSTAFELRGSQKECIGEETVPVSVETGGREAGQPEEKLARIIIRANTN